ncbi:MAG: HDOD domain-containing protein [Thermodesulfobacteriota bacterium]
MAQREERLQHESRSHIKNIIRQIDILPSPPAVAAMILSMAVREDTDVRTLTHFIESDPSLAMRVLKMANAARYGRVQTLTQAVNLLGFNAVKNILLTIAVRDTVFREPFSGDPDLTGLWKHSLACAVGAAFLADRNAPDLAELAFAAGLAHDCGKLIMLAAFPDRYGPLLRAAENAHGALLDAENEAFEADHCLAGKWLAETWNLPRPLVDAMWLHHHPPEQLALMGGEGRLALLVAAANTLAHEVMSDRDPSLAAPARRDAFQALGIFSEAEAASLASRLGEGYAERAEIFDLTPDAGSFYFQALTRANARLAAANSGLYASNESLQGLHRVLGAMSGHAPGMVAASDEAEVLSRLADALCASGAQKGAVFLRSCDGLCLAGRWWDAGLDHAAFSWPDCDARGDRECEPPVFVQDRLKRFQTRQPPACDLKTPTRPLVSPLTGGGFRALLPGPGLPAGEMVFWPTRAPLSPQEAMAYGQLAEFTGACLARLDLLRQCREQAERMASTMRDIRNINAKLGQAERLAAVGQLAAGAAHEINNPLAIVYARVQLLELKETDQAKKKSLHQLLRQIERISSILTNLMNFARPAPPVFTTVDVGDLLEKTLSLAQAGLEKQGIRVHRGMAGDLPEIQGDAHQLEQVFLNLIINAEHAMEKGGLLTVSTRHDPASAAVVVGVEDTGIGISQETLTKIFDPFFTTKSEGKGTGLGLSTAYAIVAAHGGEIRVESTPHKGTRMEVVLPRERNPKRTSGEQGSIPNKEDPPKGILVVDDERNIRDILTEALEANGYGVATASNGVEAMERLRKENYRLVILDIRMPLRGGLDVLRELTASGSTTPVLVLTGLAGPEELAEAKALGAAGHLTKPFQIDSLMREIRRLLGQESTP